MAAKKTASGPKAKSKSTSTKAPKAPKPAKTSSASKAAKPTKTKIATKPPRKAETRAKASAMKGKASSRTKASSMAAPKAARKAKPKADRGGLLVLVERYRASFDAAQAELTARYGLGKKGGVWAYDQKTQELRFTAEGMTVVARASLLGSWSNESWLWAWANDSILEPVSEASREVRDAATKLGITELTTPMYFASAEVVERVAVAAFGLLGAKGCYFPSTATGKLVFLIHALGERVPAT